MREKVSYRRVKHPRYRYLVTYPEVLPDGSSVRRKAYFETQDEAKTCVAEKRVEVLSHGAKHAHVTDGERTALIRFRTWAAGRREPIELLDLINEAIEAKEKNTFNATIQDLIDARVLQAQKKRSAPRHLRDLEQHLNRFAGAFGKRLASEVRPEEIEKWIHGLNVKPITFHNYKRAIGSIFTLGVKQGKVPSNPVIRVEAPKVIRSAPRILTPAELSAVLEAATDSLLPIMVLQAFAGVRRAEAERLSWDLIHLDTEIPCVELPSEVTKTNRRRTIELQPNAAAWLRLCPRRPGLLGTTEDAYRKELAEAAKAADIDWEVNLLRHSYGSYRMGQVKNAAVVAEEMGNSPNVVRTFYHNLVRPEAVAKYWHIMPKRRVAKGAAYGAEEGIGSGGADGHRAAPRRSDRDMPDRAPAPRPSSASTTA